MTRRHFFTSVIKFKWTSFFGLWANDKERQSQVRWVRKLVVATLTRFVAMRKKKVRVKISRDRVKVC